MDRDEPVHQREVGAVHHGTCLQACPVTAVLALPLISVRLPVVVYATALGANYASLLSLLLEMPDASILIGKFLIEAQQVHNEFFYYTKVVIFYE